MSAVFPITADTRFRISTATGGQTAFSVPFPFQDNADIAVIKVDGVSGVETQLTETTHYTLSGAGNPAGGTVTLVAGAAAGDQYIRVGKAVLARVLSVVRSGKFRSRPMDDDFDRFIIIAQELARDIAQSWRSPLGQEPGAIEPGGASQLAMFDGDGNIVATQTIAEIIAASLGSIGAVSPQIFDTLAIASAYHPLLAPNWISTLGYAAAGDGGGARYRKVVSEPSHAGKFSITIAVLGTVVWYELAEFDINVKMLGAKGDGLTLDTVAIQNALDIRASGVVTIPGATWNVGDISLLSKNSNSDGTFVLRAHGARFAGSGRVIVDSSKRVAIIGLKAQSHILSFRGCWWSSFYDCSFKDLQIGDVAGATFSSCYWNNFYSCVLQRAIVSSTLTEGANAFFWHGCTFRGDNTQGFASSQNYALIFQADQDAQNWVFYGGDISYFNTGIIQIDVGNTQDVELKFKDVYFDSVAPEPQDGAKRKVVVKDCHVAGKILTAAPLKAAARGEVSVWEAAHTAGWKSFGAVNFLANGDLARSLADYQLSMPFQTYGGATVTEHAGDGPGGRYLNINQATAGTIRLRSIVLPFTAIYNASLLVRRAGGPESLTVAIGGQSFAMPVSADWTLFSTSANAEIAGGATTDVTIVKAGGAAFNIDFCYACVSLGNQPPLLLPQGPNNDRVQAYRCKGAKSHNWASINAGASASTTVTVPGAALGDPARATMSIDLAGIVLQAYVSAADTVTVYATNLTGSPVDLAGGTLTAWVG